VKTARWRAECGVGCTIRRIGPSSACCFSHTDTQSTRSPTHRRIQDSKPTPTPTHTHSLTLPSMPMPMPIPPPPPRTILPNPRQRYCPPPARLNLPGALHEQVIRLCCASQSDRVTPRPSLSVLLVTLRVTACCCTLFRACEYQSHPKTRCAARRRLVCLACTTCLLTVLPLLTITITSITVQVILLSHSRCGVAFFNFAQPCRSSRSLA